MKIYLACSLTHLPQQHFGRYVSYLHALAASLRGIGGVEAVKYALLDSDPQLKERPPERRAELCYAWDRQMIEDADLVVADASFPSTGMGVELQIAEGAGKPIIMLVGDYGDNRVPSREYENPDHSRHHLQVGEGVVSLMALGVPTISQVIQYACEVEAIQKASEAVALFVRPS
ncbi:nucleoside 2-deoxyribosyltransferase [Sphingomonas sp. URHD0057]|uniref:nucleoside 2-deoxyribosyltransferase n=1 Tax=Sphingomonas sp. URHD0057 TaxID=1380389 RepID=UPI0018CC56CD|nr:nucleoside 2-deoxyribosyltransferase [Sphingomonas sp. URHD0057]